LENLQSIDDKKLYSIIDYPIGGITNLQMNNALTDAQEGFYQVGSVYMCTDDGTYLKNHFYKFNELSWEDVTPEFAGELKDLTLEELESEVIDEDTLYNIKDYPIGGISSLQMVNALKPEQLGFYQVGSVYLCTDDYSDYIKHHFYRFDYNEETDTYSWVDTKAGADIDKELSLESENPVANKIVTEALEGKISLTGNDNIYGIKSFESRPKLGINEGLPNEYQEVEYIESTGAQYIDLPFGFDSTDEIIANFSVESSQVEDKYIVSPTAWNTNNNRFGLGIHNGCYTFAYGTVATSNTLLTPNIYNDGKNHKWVYKGKICQINDEDVNCLIDVNNITFGSTTTNLRLFYGYSSNTKGKIYSYTHYKNNIKICDLIPCYRVIDNIIGLYDIVNAIFYENNGSSVFLKGKNVYRGIDFATVDDVSALQPDIDSKVSLNKDEVIKGQKVFTERPQIGEARLPSEFTEVEYIESTGTQWIDTGVATANVKFETKVQFTELGRRFISA
jgi:hypothetical protein